MQLPNQGAGGVPGAFVRILLLVFGGLFCNGAAWALSAEDNPLFDSSGTVRSIANGPDGSLYIGGSFLMSGSSNYTVIKLRADGSVDPGFAPDLFDYAFHLEALDNGQLLVAQNSFDRSFGELRLLNPDGSDDPDFVRPFVNGNVWEILVDADGSILLAGEFSEVDGVTRRGLARLHPDGQLDQDFDANLSGISIAPPRVLGMERTVDGRLMVAGRFNQVDGVTHRHLARLMPDGRLDETFSAELRSDEDLVGLGLRADDSMIVFGSFASIDNVPRQRLALLASDGTLLPGFNPGPDSWVNDILIQPDGRTVLVGSFGEIGGLPFGGLARLMPDGSVDPSMEFDILGGALVVIQDSSAKGILVGGSMSVVNGLPRTRFFRVADSGKLQQSLAPSVAGGDVQALSIQADDRLLIGGQFNDVGGVARSGLARLDITGELDEQFDPAPDGAVRSIAALDDGGSIVAGDFAVIDQQPASRIARLDADGALDPAFEAAVDGPVLTLALYDDGGMLIGGSFSSVNGQARANLARLNPDGTLDAAFIADSDGEVRSLAIDDQQRILVGGSFTEVGGLPRANLARLTDDGLTDDSFSADTNADVYVVRALPNGGIVVGGLFSTVAGISRDYLARLAPDGTVDAGFDPAANGPIFSLAVQTDEKLLVAGQFDQITGVPVQCCVARLNPDGSLDGALQDGLNSGARIDSLAIQGDGQVLIGGTFFEIGGQLRPRLARLQPRGGRPVQNLELDPNGSRITWQRSRFAAELDRVIIDFSANGNDWTELGQASRVPEGWRFDAPGLPDEELFYLRARGSTAVAQGNGSTALHRQGLQAWWQDELFSDGFEQEP